jgi:hypothetical protein
MCGTGLDENDEFGLCEHCFCDDDDSGMKRYDPEVKWVEGNGHTAIMGEAADGDWVEYEEVEKMKKRNDTLFKALVDAHNWVTDLTGQNGMSPEHHQWIQDLFMTIEMEAYDRSEEP